MTKINFRVSRFSLSPSQCCLHATFLPELGEPEFKSAEIFAWNSWNSQRIVVLVENCTSERRVKLRRPNSHASVNVLLVVISLQ